MSLNIKNERVCALAREAAERLGTTQTSAIEQALEKLIADHRDAREERRRRVMATLERIDSALTDEDRAAMRAFQEDMYDETGLPR